MKTTLSFLFLLATTFTFANTFYVDPINGSMANDGSLNAPWSTLQEVVNSNKIQTFGPINYPFVVGDPMQIKNLGAPVQAGDTILCFGGFQGALSIDRHYNPDYIHIAGIPGHSAEFSSVELRGCSYWSFDNIVVSTEFDGSYGTGKLFDLNSHVYQGGVHHVIIENSSFYSKWDAYAWGAADWTTKASSAIKNAGQVDNIIVRNNYIKNVDFGIHLYGQYCWVEGNIIENFSGDGMRGLGKDMYFYYNTAMNGYQVDLNHDDLFQSFVVSGDSLVERIHLVGNLLIGSNDPNQPTALLSDPQGIGLFDGFFEDCVFTNNVVVVNHYHGISLYGARNCTITNNTVVKNDFTDIKDPSIRVFPHKDGRPSTNNTVANNVYHKAIYNLNGTIANNIQVEDPDYPLHFVDPINNDFRLTPTSSLIDAGIASHSPAFDRDSIERPQGLGIDVGAYEYIAPIGCAAFTPVVDAQQEVSWTNYPKQYLRNNILGTVTNRTDLSSHFNVHWDASNLYVLVDVTDDFVVNDQSTSVVQDDGVSLYIDGGNEKATSYDTNDHNFTFRWNDPNIRHGNTFNTPGVSRVERLTASGYMMEISIPWSVIGVTPIAGNMIGIDVHINDDDDGGDRDKKITWKDMADLSWTNPSYFGEYVLPAPCSGRLVDVDVQMLLEGPLDVSSNYMFTRLLSKDLLPSNQPYWDAPWNYNGLEGEGWASNDYPTDAVDWVHISLRESLAAETEVASGVAVLLNDGYLAPFELALEDGVTEVYVVVEHRNHLPAISKNLVPIINNQLVYDFRAADSYSGIGAGQKMVGSNWCLYAGNGDHNGAGNDINGVDRILWQTANGNFNQYLRSDFDLDGDVNAADKLKWDANNGVFSEL